MKVTIEISRYLPGRIEPPRLQSYEVEVAPGASVLDALEQIRIAQDASLMYRHSCHHSSCGTCAMRINGEESLACTTRIEELRTPTVSLAPLEGFERIGDLAVDMRPFFERMDEGWSYLRESETPGAGGREGPRLRFEDCIECAACVSACPVSGPQRAFRGPAALAALAREMVKYPDKAHELLQLAAGPDGAGGCRRALRCSRVCPTGVYPARSIHDLLKRLDR